MPRYRPSHDYWVVWNCAVSAALLHNMRNQWLAYAKNNSRTLDSTIAAWAQFTPTPTPTSSLDRIRARIGPLHLVKPRKIKTK